MIICDYCGRSFTDPAQLTAETVNTCKSNFIRTPERVRLCAPCLSKLKFARYNAEVDFYKQIERNRKKRAKAAKAQTLDEYETAYLKALVNAPEK